ncbi:hypothetical protein D3Z41_15475, partial [Parabacteroides distasonis]|nr:hypothetical protein [Parabacteroides distasonis]
MFPLLIVIILAQNSETIISHRLHTYYNDVTTYGLDSKTTKYGIRLKLTSSISLLRNTYTKGFYIICDYIFRREISIQDSNYLEKHSKEITAGVYNKKRSHSFDWLLHLRRRLPTLPL